MQPRFNEALSNRCELLQARWQRTEAAKRRGVPIKIKTRDGFFMDLWRTCLKVLGENLFDGDSDCSEEELEESSSHVGASF